MRPRRAGPLLAAGAAFAAGDLAGLRWAAGTGGMPPGLLLAAALLAVLPAVLREGGSGKGSGTGGSVRSVPGASLRTVAALLAACALAGGSVGLAAGRSAAASCLAALEPRSDVRAVGVTVHDVPGAGEGRVPAAGRFPPPGGEAAGGPGRVGRPRPPSRRVDLVSVRLRSASRTCRVPGLLARVAPPAAGVAAGRTVRLEGRWIRFDGAGRAVRPLARYGMIRGRLLATRRPGPGDEPGSAGHRSGAGPFASAAIGLRARAGRRLGAVLSPETAPLGRALVLARRSGLEPGLARRFADAGMAHLLAISGLHVGLLAAGVLWIVGRAVRGRTRYLVAAGLVGGYVVVIGAPAAALRAALLFAGWAAGRHRGAPARPTDLVGAAAVVALLADPLALLGAGFQLSFAGFGGLLLGGAAARRIVGAAERRWRRGAGRWRGTVLAVAAGAGAFAATAPLAALHFQRTAPVAVVSNFAGVPLVTLALSALVGALLLPGAAARLAGAAADTVLRLLVATVDLFAGLPFGHGDVAPPGPVFWLVAACVGVAVVRFARGLPAVRAAVPLGLAAAVGLAGPVAAGLAPGGSLVCQLDVGQGDAAVVRTRRGHWLVFDAGPRFGSRNAGLRVVVPFLRDRGARSVDLFVLSHPDLDHLGGAGALLDRFRVGTVLDAGNPLASGPYAAFLDAVAEEGARWLPARPGARIRVDEVEVTVLGPVAGGRALWRGRPREANEASVAVRVAVGEGFVYLNPGDAPREQEERILARWPDDTLRAVVLKAGHHGSRTSSGRRWLAAVRPRVAVVSAGAGNRYGHPHPAALGRLEASGAGRVWRTDRDGHLCVEVRRNGAWRIRGEEVWRPGLAADSFRAGLR